MYKIGNEGDVCNDCTKWSNCPCDVGAEGVGKVAAVEDGSWDLGEVGTECSDCKASSNCECPEGKNGGPGLIYDPNVAAGSSDDDDKKEGDKCEDGDELCECEDDDCKIHIEEGKECEKGSLNCHCDSDGKNCVLERPDDDPTKSTGGGNTGLIVVLVLAAVGGIAGAFYCKT